MTVSVVMATYNGAPFIQEQLTSILEGERPPDELVIVDDGSTDGTQDLILQAVKDHPTVSVLFEQNDENLGASCTFRKAVLRSSGDLILFADQDDVWMPDKIKEFVSLFAERADLLMGYSDGVIVDKDLQPMGHTIYSSRNRANLEQGGDRDPLEVAANPDIKGCTMTLNGDFARKIFTKCDVHALTYWGHDHWAALFAYGLGSVGSINKPLIDHRFHRANASAGTRFNPLYVEQLRRYLRTAHDQGHSYFTERYHVALAHAVQFEPGFSPALMDALKELLSISIQRRDLHELPIIQRFRAAWRLHRAGVYDRYYNGFYTMLRDALL